MASAFGSIGLEGKTYLTARSLPTTPTLALRAGALRTLGTWPFFEGATLGGRYSFRGTSPRRFVGDAAAYGNAELRLNLGAARLPFGGDWGIWGLADAGRVWLDGQTSGRWHRAVGAGFWAGITDRYLVTVAAATSSEDKPRFYFHTGFHF